MTLKYNNEEHKNDSNSVHGFQALKEVFLYFETMFVKHVSDKGLVSRIYERTPSTL